jgi:hypothetical protein
MITLIVLVMRVIILLVLVTTKVMMMIIMLMKMAMKMVLAILLIRMVHCNENPIYVFLFSELCGLSPNFHIHVSVRDLYISRIGPHIFLQQNRQTDPGNI